MRDSYYNTITDQNGKLQLDLLSSIFKDFKNFIKNKFVKIITIDDNLENKADLISYKYYGAVNYWWLICEVNNITDPLTELTRGKQLAIPSLSDILLYIQSKQSSNYNNVKEVSL